MAIITYYRNNYNMQHIHQTLVEYALHPKIYNDSHQIIGHSTATFYGGHNIYYNDVATGDTSIIDRQMFEAAKFYNKDFGKCLLHFSIDYDTQNSETHIVAPVAYQHALFICKKFLHSHQVFFAVHENTDHLHTHFVLNSINLDSGLKIAENNLYKNLTNFINSNKFIDFAITGWYPGA